MRNVTVTALMLAVSLSGCAKLPGQHQYGYQDVGKSTFVEFGTVIAVRNVDITGPNSGVGSLVGAGVGAGAGSYLGGGSGEIWAIAGGLLAGAIAGAVAEQAITDNKGLEYTVTKENGQTVTIVQNMNPGDQMIPVGSRVIVQASGGYQRVLPASHLPDQIKRPQSVKVVD